MGFRVPVRNARRHARVSRFVARAVRKLARTQLAMSQRFSPSNRRDAVKSSSTQSLCGEGREDRLVDRRRNETADRSRGVVLARTALRNRSPSTTVNEEGGAPAGRYRDIDVSVRRAGVFTVLGSWITTSTAACGSWGASNQPAELPVARTSRLACRLCRSARLRSPAVAQAHQFSRFRWTAVPSANCFRRRLYSTGAFRYALDWGVCSPRARAWRLGWRTVRAVTTRPNTETRNR